MKYRSEIDGLRTVAIVPVLLFHAGIPYIGGGYVGVDVFFTISGYLITKIISEEMLAGRFRISNFYERRVRRILPCFFVVLIVSAVAASLLFLPRDFDAFCKSAVSAIFFASNFKFYREAGYFDAAADTKPLLHTWSLAVEEQFYIFFPIALYCLYRWAPRRVLHVLVPVAILSFALSLWATDRAPVFNFFLAPTRIWELFVGSFLALGIFPDLRAKPLREALAALGVGLIAWAVFAFRPETPFPGANALFPVLGAALIIYASQQTMVGRVLSLRPVVFIGLISYSLYMWHWPIIVFTKYYLLRSLVGWESVAVIVASVVLATFSWHFVERPFRTKGVVSRRTIFASAAAAMSLASVVALAGHFTHGWVGRFPPAVRQIAEASQDFSPLRQKCHSTETYDVPPEKSCVYGAHVEPTYAIWGDSHAVELAYALGELAAAHNLALVQLSSSACPPTIGYTPANRLGCDDRNRSVMRYLLADGRLRTVFLVSSYSAPDAAAEPALGAGLDRAVHQLEESGREVVLIYPTPDPSTVIPNALARYLLSGKDPAELTIKRDDYQRKVGPALTILDEVPAGPGTLQRVKPVSLLCNDTDCKTYADGRPLYFDDLHLSMAGARYIAPLFSKYFAPELQGQD